MNSQKGFLFTIAAIFFASTLVFFAQGFYDSNLVSEREIMSSALPLNIVSINEDLAIDITGLFDMWFDVNSNENSVLISGRMSASSTDTDSLTNYSSFISSKYFPRIVFDESLDLSNLSDGKAEFFLGDELKLDYNYGNSLALFSNSSLPFESLDLNIGTNGTLSSYEWVSLGGDNNFLVSINYSDDSNALIIQGTVDNNSSSYLKLVYSDGNTFVRLGRVNYLGVDYNGAFLVSSKRDQVINYGLKANYFDVLLYPLKINSSLRVRANNIDSNTMLTLYK